ncbi:MAG: hypothetical protein ABEL76_14735 [Bradymonadaceae bacterium]
MRTRLLSIAAALMLVAAAGCSSPSTSPGSKTQPDASGEDAVEQPDVAPDAEPDVERDVDEGPEGFTLEGGVSGGGVDRASGGSFSLEGHVVTTHSGKVCEGGGWKMTFRPLRARE